MKTNKKKDLWWENIPKDEDGWPLYFTPEGEKEYKKKKRKEVIEKLLEEDEDTNI